MSLQAPGAIPDALLGESGVSIAATVLNEAQDIAALVNGLLAQQPSAKEVIVVDGGSTDGTWEWLEGASALYPALIAVRDESCSLRYSAGPIARGRNAGIRRATAAVVACADAGCSYAPDWLRNLTAPIFGGKSEYALGGSALAPEGRTVWDLASAPFFGVKLGPAEPTKSCTARSMAFTRVLWERVGGFPETVFLGEDTLFDGRVRALTRPAFVHNAKALYRPHHTFVSALQQMASYARTDGVLGVRPARMTRHILRCLVEAAALGVLILTRGTGAWASLLFALVLAVEVYFAFRLDWRQSRAMPFPAQAARILFSLTVPWVVTWNQIAGSLRKTAVANRQNRA